MRESKHFAALDGLRGIAALFVLIGHLELPFLHPQHFELAVDFFFLLSGFVIAHAYEQKLQNGMSFWEFARIRLLRLYPLILLGVSIGAAILFMRAYATHDDRFFAPGLITFGLAAVVLPSPLLQYTVGDGAFPLNVPAWSLLVELAINAAYAMTARRITDRVLALIIVVGAFLILTVGVNGGSTWQTLWIGGVRVLFSFPAGIALYRLYRNGRLPKIALPFPAVAALLILAFCIPRGWGVWSYVGESFAVLLLFPTLVAAGVRVELGASANKAALFIGKLSYPLYVIHHPLLKPFANIIRTHELTGWIFVLWTILEISTIIVVAYLAMRFFDEPVRRRLASLVLKRRPA